VSGREVDFIGPALDAAFVKNFFIEVDAFYHPIEVSTRTVLSNGEVVDSFSGAEGRTFEFPVLGKYQFGTGRVKPFVEVGPSFRAADGELLALRNQRRARGSQCT
jgi:hypothetical protein